MPLNKIKKTISYICKNEYNYFLNKKNVIGVGLGYKVSNGFYTSDLCIQVFVVKKIRPYKLCVKDIIPPYFKGLKTDVIESSNFTETSLTKRIRPVLGGYSISCDKIYSNGTLGCLVTDGADKFILSNNHVIARLNELSLGYPIIEPAYKYGGKSPKDTIGTLHRYIPLNFTKGENYSDAAIALLTKRDISSSKIALIGNLKGIKPPTLNKSVQKVGGKTELTYGTIQSINVTFELTYSIGKKCLFKDQIIVSKMSKKGDSGAILLDKHKYGIGLLFSESNTTSVFNRLDRVLDELDVELVF